MELKQFAQRFAEGLVFVDTNTSFVTVGNRRRNRETGLLEDGITFFGSSFISDPYGRILARAGSSGSALLVADLDLDQKRDWLTLFPFFKTRRPSMYKKLNK
jgi:N-carbamoylputrescine amidase